MGGPNNLDEVEVFLKNMFADKNILTMRSNLLRKFVGSMIVFSRVEAAQEIYRKLGGKSPIVGHTKKLVQKLQQQLGDEVYVDFVMRYTPPFSSEVITKLNNMDIKQIYLIPLYPQYSTTTTKSSLEEFEQSYFALGGDALLYETKHFFENKKYNKAVVDTIVNSLGDEKADEFELVFSAHGLPQKIVDNGDVYQKHLLHHVEILKQMLEQNGINFSKIDLAYQSKVGPMKWLEPSLEDKLKEIKSKKVMIYPISFCIDNSETDFELGVEYGEIADELGFEEYRVCRSLNDSPLFVEALEDIYKKLAS